MRRKPNNKLKVYLTEHAKELTVTELLPLVNKEFNENYNRLSLQKYLIRNKIQYKYECEYKSHNNAGISYPIGTEYVKPDGMIIVKVKHNQWKDKQRYVYEQYYNVELRSDEFVIFLDNDRTNFDIDNLKVVSKRVASYLANQDLKSNYKDITNLGITTAELMIKVKDYKKEDA